MFRQEVWSLVLHVFTIFECLIVYTEHCADSDDSNGTVFDDVGVEGAPLFLLMKEHLLSRAWS